MRRLVLILSFSIGCATHGMSTIAWHGDYDPARPVNYFVQMDAGDWSRLDPVRNGDDYTALIALPEGTHIVRIRSCEPPEPWGPWNCSQPAAVRVTKAPRPPKAP